jgi:hypothetical protein
LASQKSQFVTLNFAHVAAFNVVGGSGKGCCKPIRLQRYNFFFKYANLFANCRSIEEFSAVLLRQFVAEQ